MRARLWNAVGLSTGVPGALGCLPGNELCLQPRVFPSRSRAPGWSQAGGPGTYPPPAAKRLGPAAKALLNKYPLVVLHSRHFAGSSYWHSAFSFVYETTDEQEYGSDVQLLFDNGGRRSTFDVDLGVDQQSLVVDLGTVPFDRDPNPKAVDIDGDNSWQTTGHAVEGHVYLERVRDDRGNRFYVLFQIVAVDPQSDYMAFVWRRLPGGKVVKRP